MRHPAPMRLGPSMITPGPTETSGASSTSGAMRALGSMAIWFNSPGEFPQVMIFQKIIAAGLQRQTKPQRAFQEASLEEKQVQESQRRSPDQLEGQGPAALLGHFSGRQTGVAVLARRIFPQVMVGIVLQGGGQGPHRAGHLHFFMDLPVAEAPPIPAEQPQGGVGIPAQGPDPRAA